MKPPHEPPLADDVSPRDDQVRLARQWGAVSRGLASRPRRRLFVTTLAAALAVALAALVLVIARPWSSTRPAAVASTPDSVVLPDGSHLTLSSGAEVTLESATRERVHILLGVGVVDLDVTHVDGRSFVVSAAGHDVTVLGTAFRVKLVEVEGKRMLGVDVTRGRVRVAGPSGEHILDAGQTWSARVDGVVASPPAGSVDAAARVDDEAPGTDAAEAPTAALEPGRSAGKQAIAAPSASVAAPAAPPVEGARELLARATDARSAGHPREAALALDTLRKRHRADPRAGLAAFELGRVRMDALSDPGGAAEAFGDAIVLSPSAPFREDAEARRVDALDALPDRARCARARDAYLARYATGLHAKQVAQRCKAP